MGSKFINSIEKTGQRSLALEGREVPSVGDAVSYQGFSPAASHPQPSLYSLQPIPQDSVHRSRQSEASASPFSNYQSTKLPTRWMQIWENAK